MALSVTMNTLSQKLIKQITARGMEAVEKKAATLVRKVHEVALDWRKIVREHLSKPAISRGKTKGNLNPHNRWGFNQGFPMLASGDLRKSPRVLVRQWRTKGGITITVKRWFAPTMNARGLDYGEKLDEDHLTLMGWKERAYDLLDARIRRL